MKAAELPHTWIDLSALFAALDDERHVREMSWRQVAAELGLAPSFFTRLREGSEPGSHKLCLLCDWIGNGITIDSFRAPYGQTVPDRFARPSDDVMFPDTSMAMGDAIREAATR